MLKVLSLLALAGVAAALKVGVGIGDTTGPAADVNMMGYADMDQTTDGIHIRLRARAFVAQDDAGSTIAYCSVDAGMSSEIMMLKVLEGLEAAAPGVFSQDNVVISGTHSHSGSAGFLEYTLFQVTSLGFVHQAFHAKVDGIVAAVLMAYESMREATIVAGTTEISDASANRSPTSYLENPADERAQYDADVDTTMTLLKFLDADSGEAFGTFNWFAVHGTSMNKTNHLISGDNKGRASYVFEREMNGADVPTGKGAFVAGFGSANLGDVSPNIGGAECIDTGLPCDEYTSTCDGKVGMCVAFGPDPNDMFHSTQIIGDRQYQAARALFDAAATPVAGDIDFRSTNVQMDSLEVDLGNNETATTCLPAMGESFAAGTTDGVGSNWFEQGDNSTENPFLDAIAHLIAEPTKEDEACHSPKPILIMTGRCTYPYDWAPHVVPISILRLGNFVILAVPAEFTTMSGRRLRDSVRAKLVAGGVIAEDDLIVIAGLSDAYADYVTTFEEYQAQRYEAASTIYGPHTLQGYIQEFGKLADAMAAGEPVDAGPAIPDLYDEQWELLPGVVVDGHTLFGKFGAVEKDVEAAYQPGDVAQVTFQSANPRNNLMTDATFLTVERQDEASGDWQVILNDGDWETRFIWGRHSKLTDESFATIEWAIPADQQPGTYRIQHFGYSKPLIGDVKPFTGTSSTFTVSA